METSSISQPKECFFLFSLCISNLKWIFKNLPTTHTTYFLQLLYLVGMKNASFCWEHFNLVMLLEVVERLLELNLKKHLSNITVGFMILFFQLLLSLSLASEQDGSSSSWGMLFLTSAGLSGHDGCTRYCNRGLDFDSSFQLVMVRPSTSAGSHPAALFAAISNFRLKNYKIYSDFTWDSLFTWEKAWPEFTTADCSHKWHQATAHMSQVQASDHNIKGYNT